MDDVPSIWALIARVDDDPDVVRDDDAVTRTLPVRLFTSTSATVAAYPSSPSYCIADMPRPVAMSPLDAGFGEFRSSQPDARGHLDHVRSRSSPT